MKSLRFVFEATVQGAPGSRVQLNSGLAAPSASDVAERRRAPSFIRSRVTRQGHGQLTGFEETSYHIATGLEYLPAVARPPASWAGVDCRERSGSPGEADSYAGSVSPTRSVTCTP
jgi:hypothetical protein